MKISLRMGLLLAFVLVQMGYLLWQAQSLQARLDNGKAIMLETAPVDPRDLLRGDFVILNYKISRLAKNMIRGDIDKLPRNNGRVFVVLEPNADDFYEIVYASADIPQQITENQVVLQGKYRHRHSNLQLKYGLERWYVAEGTGTPPADSIITARARIGKGGVAMLEQIFIDGAPYALKMTEIMAR